MPPRPRLPASSPSRDCGPLLPGASEVVGAENRAADMHRHVDIGAADADLRAQSEVQRVIAEIHRAAALHLQPAGIQGQRAEGADAVGGVQPCRHAAHRHRALRTEQAGGQVDALCSMAPNRPSSTVPSTTPLTMARPSWPFRLAAIGCRESPRPLALICTWTVPWALLRQVEGFQQRPDRHGRGA